MQSLSLKKAQENYRKHDVLTANPLDIVIMLYDGIRKNITLARRAIERKDMVSAHNKLIKAQDIVNELINCLDLSIPLSEDLLRIYDFILHSLGEANLKKDASSLGDVLEITENLRGAWHELSQSVRDGALTEPEENA